MIERKLERDSFMSAEEARISGWSTRWWRTGRRVADPSKV